MTRKNESVSPSRGRRTYNSSQRAGQALQTRARIKDAARAAFEADGFRHTTMRAIAAGAVVSEATVFLAFPTKAELLSTVIREAVRGPEPDVRLTDGVLWQELLTLPSDQMLERFAGYFASVLSDVALLLEVGDVAASENPDIAALRRRGREAERATVRTITQELFDRGDLLAPLGADDAADSVTAIASHEVYLRLTRDRNWRVDAYREWLSRTVKVLLLGSRQ